MIYTRICKTESSLIVKLCLPALFVNVLIIRKILARILIDIDFAQHLLLHT